jgi:hypothetical protein
MEIKELEKAYKKLIEDPQFDYLSEQANEPNIFSILALEHYEIRHSNFLGWLIDPRESHGLGDYFIKHMLRDILIDERISDISVLEIGNLDISSVEVRREWKNIDVLIITKEFVVCIENKIWSGENGKQLIKYKKIIEESFPDHRKSYVFLTPGGTVASEHETYIEYSYRDIVQILKNILEYRNKQLETSVKIYISDYLKTLERNIMGEDNTTSAAKQLYLNHKELFDFVWQHKPDVWDDFAKRLREKCEAKGWIIGSKNKGYVRFLPKEIEPYILRYKKANGWPSKEAFLFEFEFYYGDKLHFKTGVSPAVDYKDYDQKLVEILKKVDGVRESLGESWKVFFIETINWPL